MTATASMPVKIYFMLVFNSLPIDWYWLLDEVTELNILTIAKGMTKTRKGKLVNNIVSRLKEERINASVKIRVVIDRNIVAV